MENVDPPGNGVFSISERLDALRREILNLEIELAKYGFDPRRGIESYSVSEIKDLLERAGSNYPEVKELLIKLVETQERLYKELYSFAGLKELNVDTETPEKNVMKIKEWLLAGKAPARDNSTKFKHAIEEVTKALQKCHANCGSRVLEVLVRIYKRDYDRYRVIKRVIEVCIELGGLEEPPELETLPIESAVTLIDECAKKLGHSKLALNLKFKGVKS